MDLPGVAESASAPRMMLAGQQKVIIADRRDGAKAR
jgi:hypothetical protein